MSISFAVRQVLVVAFVAIMLAGILVQCLRRLECGSPSGTRLGAILYNRLDSIKEEGFCFGNCVTGARLQELRQRQ